MTQKKGHYTITWNDRYDTADRGVMEASINGIVSTLVARHEKKVHSLILVALCSPMGRVRRELLVKSDLVDLTENNDIIGLSEYYP